MTVNGTGAEQPAYREIEYRVAERIATITLNVPERHNPISVRMRREIVDALRRAEGDDAVSVVLVKGAGASFSSGYEMGAARDAGGPPPRPAGWVDAEQFNGWTDQWARGVLRDWSQIWTLLKPVVAQIHGHCIAGGTELMAICDIAFASDTARISYPPVRGMGTPDIPYFPWKLPMAQAKYLQLTGNAISGKEAAAMGLVAKSFPAEELDERVDAELRAMASIPAALLSANKQQLNEAYDIQGMWTHLNRAWMWHQLSSTARPDADRFARVAREAGLKAALEWRDGAFQKEGL
jgi:enoyl-CoA hydratase